jgi:hypothetical protein
MMKELLVVKRKRFGSDPIARGEEKRLKGILVSSGSKNDLKYNKT